MLVRVHVAGTTVKEIQQFLLSEIRTEYQHNITQQLYVSAQAWIVIARIKDDTISMINNTASSLAPDASSVELSKIILTHLAGLEDNPYDAGLMLLKHDMQQFF
jgi:ribosomal protein S3AE